MEKTAEMVDGAQSELFVPRHLNAQQLEALFAEDLQRAEAATRGAWVALMMARMDYAAACARVALIEAERDRLREY
jgi:hypothetical protein